ncbi:MAG: asparagine synthase (glutamine-hydrolyzing), partial [Gammaproteobacteria bacterium]
MCGIAGLVNFNGTSVSSCVLEKMTTAIAHRGPDGEGIWIDRNVGLGHRRLAILDLSSAGDQPMTSTDGRYVLTYNGEIYNYKELRTELKKIGFDFVSESDTEVLLYAIIAWGVKAIPKLNGMFAFAFWDKHKQELILARDRYGIKPLYYSCINGTLAFGSEQKALLAQPGFARRINKEALIEYFTFQNIFTDKTLLDGIALFPPGHYGIVNLCKTQNKLHITQYWDYDFREPISKVEKLAYEEELNRLFLQAVNRQLVSDVELGCYLSGGMDSGSITAIAAKSHPYLKTFTCGFDLTSASGLELGFDERNKAEYMSNCFKTEHYEM